GGLRRGLASINRRIQQCPGEEEFVGGCQRVPGTDLVVACVVEGTVSVREVGGGELVEHLPEGADSGEEVTDHRIRVGGVVKCAGRVGEAAQRFGCFGSITEGVIKSGHESERLSQNSVGGASNRCASSPRSSVDGG